MMIIDVLFFLIVLVELSDKNAIEWMPNRLININGCIFYIPKRFLNSFRVQGVIPAEQI